MAKFKAGDRVRCINPKNDIFSRREYTVVDYYDEDLVRIEMPSGKVDLYFEWRFELVSPRVFTVDCTVRCIDATGSDLIEGRFYTVQDITGGGALVLHALGQSRIPYRPDRFVLATSGDWVAQTIRDKDAAQEKMLSESVGSPLTIKTLDECSASPCVNPAGWDIEIIDGWSSMPTVKFKKRAFKKGDRVHHVSRFDGEFIVADDQDGDVVRVHNWHSSNSLLAANMRMSPPLSFGDIVIRIPDGAEVRIINPVHGCFGNVRFDGHFGPEIKSIPVEAMIRNRKVEA